MRRYTDILLLLTALATPLSGVEYDGPGGVSDPLKLTSGTIATFNTTTATVRNRLTLGPTLAYPKAAQIGMDARTSGTTGRTDVLWNLSNALLQSVDYVIYKSSTFYLSWGGTLRVDGGMIAPYGNFDSVIGQTWADLELRGAGTKNVVVKLTDAVGASFFKILNSAGIPVTTGTSLGRWDINSIRPKTIYVTSFPYTAGTNNEDIIITSSTSEVQIVLPAAASNRGAINGGHANSRRFTIVLHNTVSTRAICDIVRTAPDILNNAGTDWATSTSIIGTFQSAECIAAPSGNRWIVRRYP